MKFISFIHCAICIVILQWNVASSRDSSIQVNILDINPHHDIKEENLIEKSFNETTLNLSVPKWLQDLDDESNKPKSRWKRRFNSFPKGTYIEISTLLSLRLKKFGAFGYMETLNRMYYEVPFNTAFLTPIISRIDSDHQRHHVIQELEELIDRTGQDGHQCMLRTICEVAEVPFDGGILGEIINFILSTAAGPAEVTGSHQYNDYAAAEYYGNNYGNCADIYNKCPFSFVGMFSSVHDDEHLPSKIM